MNPTSAFCCKNGRHSLPFISTICLISPVLNCSISFFPSDRIHACPPETTLLHFFRIQVAPHESYRFVLIIRACPQPQKRCTPNKRAYKLNFLGCKFSAQSILKLSSVLNPLGPSGGSEENRRKIRPLFLCKLV